MEPLTEIDESIFSELRSTMGEDFLLEMVNAFCEDSDQLNAVLQQKLVEKNQAEFTRAAHTLRSTSLIFGALQFGELARELEYLGKEGQLAGSDEKVRRLSKALHQLQIVLKDLCNG